MEGFGVGFRVERFVGSASFVGFAEGFGVGFRVGRLVGQFFGLVGSLLVFGSFFVLCSSCVLGTLSRLLDDIFPKSVLDSDSFKRAIGFRGVILMVVFVVLEVE